MPSPQRNADRIAVQLRWHVRALAAAAAAGSLGYAAVLGWRVDANGVATASAFAVGFLFATFALAGVVPANIKVGDVEVRMQQAREDGVHEGRVDGLAAGAALGRGVATGDLPVERAEAAVRTALTTPQSLRIDGIDMPVAQLPPHAAEAQVHRVADALTAVARHSGRETHPAGCLTSLGGGPS
jgi:hypothetical protein